MRKVVIAIILLLAILFSISHFSDAQKIATTLRAGDWRFVLLAVLFEMLWLWGLGQTYQSIYRILGIKENRGHLLSVAAAANFVNVIAPTAGMSAFAVFLSDARRRGHSTARVTVASAVFMLCEYLTILGAFSLGFVVLVRRHTLHLPELLAAGVLLGGALGLIALLYLAFRSTRALAATLTWLARWVNRISRPFIHREALPVGQAGAFAAEASTCVALLRHSSPPQLARPMLFSLSNKVIMIGILILSFMAFQVPFSAGTIIAGFSLAYLFAIVSPTPSGIGVVEGVLTLSLRSLGVPLEPAAVITLAFRGVTFWQPLVIGGIMLRRVNNQKETEFKQIN